MNVYRIFPVLYTGFQNKALTVYGIDRQPGAPLSSWVTCTLRVREDPASVWDSRQYYRIRLPTIDGGCCSNSSEIGDSVTYAQLPQLITWFMNNGYTVETPMHKIQPLSEIYIKGP